MITDITTRNDLNIFAQDGKKSLFSILDFTTTTSGSHKLADIFLKPHKKIEDIQNMQITIQVLQNCILEWPQEISNGTIMVVEKFLETPLSNISNQIGVAEAFFYRIFNSSDYSLIKYSMVHCADLCIGLNRIIEMIKRNDLPSPLKNTLEEIENNLPNNIFEGIKSSSALKKISAQELLRIAKKLQSQYRNQIRNLMKCHAQLDAWLSMAKAMQNFKLIFPTFIQNDKPILDQMDWDIYSWKIRFATTYR
jgi:DNA mismatch repair ATPase MutS